MDVIETPDIRLAAYAIARGGGLRLVCTIERGDDVSAVFRLEGRGMEEVEIDYAHFGPRGVTRDRMAQLVELLQAACSRRGQ